HLYRMLTELRDINKIGSCPPVFYYLIGYITPATVLGLTLGIKQDIVYTNHSSQSSLFYYDYYYYYTSTIYCWLNVSALPEFFFVFVLPIAVCVLVFLILMLLSYKELRNTTTFKQTDLSLVKQNMIG